MAGPAPAVAAVRRVVRSCLADLIGLPGAPLVLVACSGGPDSLALAHATAFVAARGGLRAGVVRVDQGWSPLPQLDLPSGLDIVRTVPGHAPRSEDAARRARYAALEQVAAELGAVTVLLGHTRDDQAETVLLGLARGSGAASLAGMAARRGVFRRPLLDLPREVTVAACAAAGLQPYEDPANRDPAFRRTLVRHRLLPALEEALGPGVRANLARTARLLRADDEALRAQAERLGRRVTDTSGDGGVPVEVLAGADAAVRARMWKQLLHPAALTSAHLDALECLVTGWRGQGPVSLPGRRQVLRRHGRIGIVDDGSPGVRDVSPADAVHGVGGDAGDAGGGPGVGGGGAGVGGAGVAVALPLGGAVAVPTPFADGHPDIAEVLVSSSQLQAKIAELAARVSADYADREVLLIGVLKGAVMVMADLARALAVPSTMEFMAVSSYGSSTSSSGVVRILKDLDRDIAGRHVLLVEDIIDSGLTLSWLLRNLRSRNPASLEVLALLRKPDASRMPLQVRYLGFDIPDAFVVGYGLDYAERYRNLPFVGILRQPLQA